MKRRAPAKTISFGETELASVKRMARPLSEREQAIAREETPYTKPEVAHGPGFDDVKMQQVRLGEDKQLNLYYLRHGHQHPEFVKQIPCIPKHFQVNKLGKSVCFKT